MVRIYSRATVVWQLEQRPMAVRCLPISKNEAHDRGLRCGNHCLQACVCPCVTYHTLRQDINAHVKRDTDDGFSDTEATVTLMGAAISACNPIVAHVLHMHERARVRTAVEATKAAATDYSDSCSDHLAVCACSCCAYEQELRLLTDISTLNATPLEANAQVTTPPTPYPPFATVSEACHQNSEQQPNTCAKISPATSSIFSILNGTNGTVLQKLK